MTNRSTTIEAPDDGGEGAAAGGARPGVVVLSLKAPDQEALRVLPLVDGGRLIVGRDPEADVPIADDLLSRRHVQLERIRGAFRVSDLGSKNGSYFDGERVTSPVGGVSKGLVRVGSHALLLGPDVGPLVGGSVRIEGGLVLGPRLARVLSSIAQLSKVSKVLFLSGETGTGKESCARAFHDAADRASPFVAVNCATIPHAIAERLLFGAKKGAYSGADGDSEGYLHAADGGTLFLDEIAELDLEVQAKLLRALETQSVTRLGATRPEAVSFRVCSATHKDLRAEVARGRFRADLFYRLAKPAVEVPPLRERLEDLPRLVAAVARDISERNTLHPTLLEACLIRPWPGNLRELIADVRAAALAARAEGDGPIRDRHLAPDAGRPLAPEAGGDAEIAPPAALPDDETIERTLASVGGNVSAAARALGAHRTQLRRWLARRAPRTTAGGTGSTED